MPLKILIHSKNCDSSGLARRFKAEGHKVSVYIKEPVCRAIGEGMFDHVSSMTEGVKDKPDLIIFDREGDGELADRLSKAGLNVCCANGLADQMELDRQFGIDMMEKAGIKVPETNHFNTVQEAIAFIKKNPKAYAIKMDGNKGAASSFVSKDEKDMLDYIQYQDEMHLIKKGTKFVLQEVVKGVEISTEVWFSKGRPVTPFDGTLEIKKFMPGDLGPNTGCETSAVFPYGSSMPRMVEKTIKKVFPIMEKAQWSGCLDINCIVSEKDHEPYGLEWTVRLGYSAIYALCAVLDGGLADFFYGIATGAIQRIPVKHSWGTSLRVSIPPYPFDNPEEPELEKKLFAETAGLRIKAPESKNWWYLDARKDEKGRTVTAGVDGTIGECTGQGETLYKAWSESKKVFDEVSVPNKQGRYIDGSERAFRDATKLRSWGYADIPSPSGQSKPNLVAGGTNGNKYR